MRPRIRGIIFDLDGTLVDSRLDFARMRADCGLPDAAPILETLAGLADPVDRWRRELVVLRHEYEGAERATLMPGAAALWHDLASRDLRTGIFTRNARVVAEYTLTRLGLAVDTLVAREDAPPKPRPEGLWSICDGWRLRLDEVLFVGDYLFDLEAGRAAGVRTLLYAPEPPDFEAGDAAVITALGDLLAHV